MRLKNLILVRHGESEGNVAYAASAQGDDSHFTDALQARHSSSLRLTERGVKQAQDSGEWIRRNNDRGRLHGYFVADYVRALETAAHLDLPNAQWERTFQLRERDMALMDGISVTARKERYPREVMEWSRHAFYAYPAGGGESMAQLCHRLSTSLLPELESRYENENVILVTHGHVIQALQVLIECLLPDEFHERMMAAGLNDYVRNGQITWYSREEPEGRYPVSDVDVWVRRVVPTSPQFDSDWLSVPQHRTWSNDELLKVLAQS